MLYNPPTGGAANDPYVGKNTAAGIQGSKVPPAAIEFTQREIVAAIVAAGLSPSNSDLTQLEQAIKILSPSAPIHIGTDVSTAANLLTVDVTPSITAYVAQHVYAVAAAHACPGATNGNFDSAGNRPIVRCDGSALQTNDWLAGARILLVDDGVSLRLVGLTVPQVLTIIAANLPALAAVAPSLSPARNLTSYLTAGTSTFTVPANVMWLYIRLVGGGGGGAGGNGSSTWAGAGGGAGGYSEGWVAVTPGQNITCIVGTGGAAGPANSNGGTGGNGGTTSFGPAMSATGGSGGSGGSAFSAGGGAGTGSGGQVNLSGGLGADGNGANANVAGGQGGASAFGGGGRTSTIAGPTNAVAAGAGGGGIWGAGGNAAAGGAGAPGAIFISC